MRSATVTSKSIKLDCLPIAASTAVQSIVCPEVIAGVSARAASPSTAA